MSKLHIDPLSVPAEWHRYLYRSILLPWEITLKNKEKFLRFNGNRPIANINLVKLNDVKKVKHAWEQVSSKNPQVQSLTFYSNKVALKDLMELLRNCVAHGHYTQHPKKGWIIFSHEYQGKIKLFGELKFSNLKELVELIGENHKPRSGLV
jgi:hypothetical protein